MEGWGCGVPGNGAGDVGLIDTGYGGVGFEGVGLVDIGLGVWDARERG